MVTNIKKFHHELKKLEDTLMPLYPVHREIFEHISSIYDSRDIDGKKTHIKKLQKYCQNPSVGLDREIINKIDSLKDLLR